ncbi:MAG: restriction endonuclease subunit S [Ruminiclostridium sp.]|nr:restriction endonuclease subunit S [Ruminiclostridium sp.]
MREMKDSGIELIESIPNEWKIIKTGYLFRENVRPSTNEDTPLSLSQVDGLIATDDMKENSLKTASYEGWKRVKIDDLVLNRFKAHLGVLFAATLSGKVSFHYGVYEKINDLVPKYFEYLYHTNPYRSILGAMSNGMTVGLQNLSNQNFYSVKSIFPPISEQAVIVDFLDEQCSEIDSLISDIQSQIETLEEYKRFVITEAVTKGLDPDVEMRDSGVQWIGEIPTHWTLIRIGSLYGLRTQKVSDIDYPPLSVTKMGVLPQLDTVAKTNAHDDRKLVVKGDFVINSRSDRRGSCGISDYNGSVSLINTVLYPITEMNPRYYNWYFHTVGFADEFYRWGHGIVDDLWTTGWQDMKNILISVPPLDEQQQIADYLDSKCAEIDSIIAEKKHQIETIEEYKKSLIFEYVTGKKEVQV